MNCTFIHLHVMYRKFANNVRHILSNSFPASSFARPICKHCVPQIYVWSHAWLWLRIRSQIGCRLESFIFWLVYALRNLSERVQALHMKTLLEKHMLIKILLSFVIKWFNMTQPVPTPFISKFLLKTLLHLFHFHRHQCLNTKQQSITTEIITLSLLMLKLKLTPL